MISCLEQVCSPIMQRRGPCNNINWHDCSHELWIFCLAQHQSCLASLSVLTPPNKKGIGKAVTKVLCICRRQSIKMCPQRLRTSPRSGKDSVNLSSRARSMQNCRPWNNRSSCDKRACTSFGNGLVRFVVHVLIGWCNSIAHSLMLMVISTE